MKIFCGGYLLVQVDRRQEKCKRKQRLHSLSLLSLSLEVGIPKFPEVYIIRNAHPKLVSLAEKLEKPQQTKVRTSIWLLLYYQLYSTLFTNRLISFCAIKKSYRQYCATLTHVALARSCANYHLVCFFVRKYGLTMLTATIYASSLHLKRCKLKCDVIHSTEFQLLRIMGRTVRPQQSSIN